MSNPLINNQPSDDIAYSVGALLYSPASNEKIASKVINKEYGELYSIALCLEDAISDNSITESENQLITTLEAIYLAVKNQGIKIPKIFIRTRSPEQTKELYNRIIEYKDILTGFIFPKYSISNSSNYLNTIESINKTSNKKIYMMPILESEDIMDLRTRTQCLYTLKAELDNIKEKVLNVRVGGNDFCKGFGIRRNYTESIYEIAVINNILGDIINIFSREYTVSGPVWEYFSSENDEWKEGLRRELKLDKLNGFIGKTVIHPKQIPIVNESLKVNQKDKEDALDILKWNNDKLAVGKSVSHERMNEVKVHKRWAEKIITLSKIYGVN